MRDNVANSTQGQANGGGVALYYGLSASATNLDFGISADLVGNAAQGAGKTSGGGFALSHFGDVHNASFGLEGTVQDNIANSQLDAESNAQGGGVSLYYHTSATAVTTAISAALSLPCTPASPTSQRSEAFSW